MPTTFKPDAASPPPKEEPRPAPAATTIAGAIGPDSPVRSIGDLPPATIRRVLAEAGSPIPPEAILAATPHTAMALAVAYKESSLGKTAPAGSFNAFGIGPGRRFADWASGTRDFARRLSTVVEPYLPEGISLERFLQIYVGGPMCPSLIAQGKACANFEDADSIGVYVWQSLERINAWRGQGGTTPAPGPVPIVFGKVPKPAISDRWITDAQNRAWDNLGDRVVRGLVYHRMLGTLNGTDGYFRSGAPGLTDYGIDHADGRTYHWNDETGAPHPGCSPDRAPHASGPWENRPGGLAFVAKYGVAGINRDLASIEISGNYDTPIMSSGFLSIVYLSAWLADQARIPWTSYPTNPATGLSFVYKHNDFQGHKPCPGASVLNRLSEIVNSTKAVLEQHQGGAAEPPGPEFPGLTIPEPVFRQLWPASLPPDPEGPFTKHIITKGTYPQVFWLKRVGDESWLSTSDGLLVYRGGKVTEVGG